MKHASCKYYDEFVTYLEKEEPEFKLKTLAKQTKCSTERIRRIRIGQYSMDVNDITVLRENYSANPMFLVEHQPPMKLIHGGQVNEPGVSYGRKSLEDENSMLREMVRTQNKLIAAYEDKLGITGTQKKRVSNSK